LSGHLATGEGDLGNIGMRDQGLADLVAETVDNVDDARWKAARLAARIPTWTRMCIRSALMTTVFPTANADASFQLSSRSGEFQGTIAATTPIGSQRVKLSTPVLSIGSTPPSI